MPQVCKLPTLNSGLRAAAMLLILATTIGVVACSSAPKASAVSTVQGEVLAKKLEMDGIENLVRATDRIYSGSEPDGEAGFASLAALGVKTIVSTDSRTPNIELATKYGMKYYHVPIDYNAVPDSAAAAAVRIERETEGPIYFHCHHGYHRGPALAAAAVQAETNCGTDALHHYLDVAGTGTVYEGLWRDALSFDIPALERKRTKLVERAKVDDIHSGMAKIDRIWDRLMDARADGWATSEREDGVHPVYESKLLEQSFRELQRTKDAQKEPEMREWLKEAEVIAATLHTQLKGGDLAGAESSFRLAKDSCQKCHDVYR